MEMTVSLYLHAPPPPNPPPFKTGVTCGMSFLWKTAMICPCRSHLSVWLAGCLSGWLAVWLAVWLSGRLSDWLSGWLAGCLAWLAVWPGCLSVWLAVWPGCLSGWLSGLAVCLAGWLSGCLSGCLPACYMDRFVALFSLHGSACLSLSVHMLINLFTTMVDWSPSADICSLHGHVSLFLCLTHGLVCLSASTA